MRFPACAALLLSIAACDSSDCNNVTSDVGDMCLSTSVAADISTTMEIRELCGPGCSHPPSCTATLRNGVVELSVEQEICAEAQYLNCVSLPCIQRITSCKLPSLPAGDYAVTAPGSPRRLIHVAEGGARACLFPGSADGGT